MAWDEPTGQTHGGDGRNAAGTETNMMFLVSNTLLKPHVEYLDLNISIHGEFA